MASPSARSIQTQATPGEVGPFDVEMMQRALRIAAIAAEQGEVPVGAVIYRGGEVIAEAHNLRESDRDPTAHAEIVALRIAARQMGSWRLSECSMAVTLEPCPMCAGALVNARLGRLVFGATDPKAGAVTTLYSLCNDQRLNHDVKVVHGVLAGESAELLRSFFRERRGGGRGREPGV